MEFRQLRYFVAVAEGGNLTVASRKLNVSQPPVTRQIRQLEAELGVTLLVRSSKGVKLTAAGAAFLSEARRLLELSTSATDRARSAANGEIGQLEVGYFGSTIYTVVPRAIRHFVTRQPGVQVKIQRVSKEDQIAQIRDGRLGIGFARFYASEPDIESIIVGEERLFVARRTESARAGLDGRHLVVFPQSGRPNFADEALKLVTAMGQQPSHVEAAEDVFAALAMVMISDAVCIVPESVAQLAWPDIAFTLLEHEGAFAPVNCIFLKNDRPPVVNAFLASLARN